MTSSAPLISAVVTADTTAAPEPAAPLHLRSDWCAGRSWQQALQPQWSSQLVKCNDRVPVLLPVLGVTVTALCRGSNQVVNLENASAIALMVRFST